jgi:hypothetical protein
VRYFEGAQIREQRLGEAAPTFSLKEGMMNATLGGPSKKQHALVASVEKVDTVNQEITIKAPDGSLEISCSINQPSFSSDSASA